MSQSSPKGTAVITGASNGIGAVYADRLAKRGYDLILVARNEAKLKNLASRLTAETGRSIQVQVADLNDKAQLAAIEATLRNDPSITLLVNNAGVLSVTPLLDSDVDQMVSMIDLNISSLTRLTYAIAPGFVSRGTGTIINVSSAVGIAVETLNGVYGATKAYVLAFSQTLQHELADKGIRIQAVLPFATATDAWSNAGMHYDNLPPTVVMKTDNLVDAALAGFDQGELVTIPPLQNGDAWNRFEAARKELSQQFGNSVPAPRYGVKITA